MQYMSKSILTILLAAGSVMAQPGYRRPSPVEQTLGDLDRVRSHSYTDRHERKHFDQARRDLIRFEDNWRRGKFDRGRLDSAIDNLSHLANAAQLGPRERDVLFRDMQALRDFRASDGGFGYRGPRRY